MRCVDCAKFQETLPAQLHYMCCTITMTEVPVWVEGREDTCEHAELRQGATVFDKSEVAK
jgi:hypothetical protein